MTRKNAGPPTGTVVPSFDAGLPNEHHLGKVRLACMLKGGTPIDAVSSSGRRRTRGQTIPHA
jgi:hypothetical protein